MHRLWVHSIAQVVTVALLGGVLVLAVTLGPRGSGSTHIQEFVAPLLLVVLMATVGGIWWSARRVSTRLLAPLVQVHDAARRLNQGDLTTRVEVAGSGQELHEIAATMNELASSLESSRGLLHREALTDSLTRLPNREAVTAHLERRLDAGESDLALLIIGIDDFKTVNDTLGHDAGDQLLTVVARRLRAVARRTDLVGRLGGDEFAVVTRTDGTLASARAVAERILAWVGGPVTLDDAQVSLSCSIGVAHLEAGESSTTALLRNADMAMYLAKGRGKQRVEEYRPDLHMDMLAQLRLKVDLAHAVARDELELHYQPVVDVLTGRILGYEALVRWQHPGRGLLQPADFISLAEDTGDIVALGDWALDRACRDQAALFRPGATSWVSVNVSAHQLDHDDFADKVRDAMRRHGVRPSTIVLEITEATLVTNTERVALLLQELQGLGVRIAIDDFGTGFSSLGYLQDLPVDIIKIDRSFVAAINGGGTPHTLEAIVGLGSAIGLQMIAEGIELPAELEHLKGLGPLGGQGYHFAEPLPLAEAAAYRPDVSLTSLEAVDLRPSG